MQVDRIDVLLKLALSAAGQNDFGERELGPIHLLKYVYLGDLAYAETHEGQTFTGAPWRFHHYGPWSLEVFQRIEPVVLATHAEERHFQSRFADDFTRWTLADDDLYRSLQRELPSEISMAVRRAVREFAADTQGLLAYVYRTRPMVRAAPSELLDFSVVARFAASPSVESAPGATASRKAQRRRAEALEKLRQRVRARLSEGRDARRHARPTTEPRYDEVFSEGQRQLDAMAGTDLPEGELKVEFGDDIWKSRGREETELP